MIFHSKDVIINNLINVIQIDIMSEAKIIKMLSEEDKNEKDVKSIGGVLGVDTDKITDDNKKSNKDDKNKDEKDKDDEDDGQTTNDDQDSQENKNFEIKIKWLSRQYDDLYNKLYTIVKSKPSVNDIFKKFTTVYTLLEFFLQNINNYTDEEKTKIYANFKIALANINKSLKEIM